MEYHSTSPYPDFLRVSHTQREIPSSSKVYEITDEFLHKIRGTISFYLCSFSGSSPSDRIHMIMEFFISQQNDLQYWSKKKFVGHGTWIGRNFPFGCFHTSFSTETNSLADVQKKIIGFVHFSPSNKMNFEMVQQIACQALALKKLPKKIKAFYWLSSKSSLEFGVAEIQFIPPRPKLSWEVTCTANPVVLQTKQEQLMRNALLNIFSYLSSILEENKKLWEDGIYISPK
jgi:hypothetical protein